MDEVISKNILNNTEISNFRNINSFINQFRNKNAMKFFIFAVQDETKACQVVERLIVPALGLLKSLETFFIVIIMLVKQ